jgi:uncharacterized membrane protein YkoI
LAGPRKRPGFFEFHYNGAMLMTRMKLLAMLCLALVAGAAASGHARASDRDRDHDRGEKRVMADRVISLDEAVARAERHHDARAVRAEEKRHGDRIEYRIRLLGADGRVFEVRIDAETGQER